MHKEKHKLAKLSVFFEVRSPHFIATVKEAAITKNKTRQTVSIFVIVFLWGVRKGGPWTRSAWGPWTGVSVFGSPRSHFKVGSLEC